MKPAPPVTRRRIGAKASRPSPRGRHEALRASAAGAALRPARCGEPSTPASARGARARPSRCAAHAYRGLPPRRSPRRSPPTCTLRRPRRARDPSASSASTSSRVASARWPTKVGQPRWSSTTATSSRSAPSRSIVRRKLCPVDPKSHDVRTTHACVTGGRLAVELRAAVRRHRVRPVRLHVRRALAPVEDVVGRVRHERQREARQRAPSRRR